jgi:hypothetical protein
MLEPDSTTTDRLYLRAVFAQGKQIPFQSLEGSFMGLSASQAQLAYLESLGAVELVRDTYGMNAVKQLLESLNTGQPAEAALMQVTRRNYKQLEQDLGEKFSGK